MNGQLNKLVWILIFVLVLLLVISPMITLPHSAGASSLERADACNTYNVHAHWGISQNGTEATFCGNSGEQSVTNESQNFQPTIVATTPPAPTTESPTLEPTSEPTEVPTETPPAEPTVKPPKETPTKVVDTICKNPNSGKDGTPEECNAGGGQEKNQ